MTRKPGAVPCLPHRLWRKLTKPLGPCVDCGYRFGRYVITSNEYRCMEHVR